MINTMGENTRNKSINNNSIVVVPLKLSLTKQPNLQHKTTFNYTTLKTAVPPITITHEL